MRLFVGVDLGGTNIKAGLVDISAGNVLISKSIPTNSRDGHDRVMKRMADLILELINDEGVSHDSVEGVGISAPGRINLEKGITVFMTNLEGKWPNVPLASTIQNYVNLPVSLLNDVRAITLAEYTYGAGRGVDDMVCYAVGTGIGGGIVIGGNLVLGIEGTAGELGHQTIDINGPRCGCGNYGCVEAFAAAPAIANMGVRAVMHGETTSIASLANNDLNKITPKLIAEAANSGDAIAQEIWRDAGHYLGTAIANSIVSFSPKRVVISGGVAAAGELLLTPVRETIQKRVHLVPLDDITVVVGELGNEAGVLGMAKWAALQAEH
ncbi:ROK family protein [bacterium]|nr:ROK family protein [bacterium]